MVWQPAAVLADLWAVTAGIWAVAVADPSFVAVGSFVELAVGSFEAFLAGSLAKLVELVELVDSAVLIYS